MWAETAAVWLVVCGWLCQTVSVRCEADWLAGERRCLPCLVQSMVAAAAAGSWLGWGCWVSLREAVVEIAAAPS